MQRRIESVKLESISEEDTSCKIAKVEEECVSILLYCLFYLLIFLLF